MLLKKCFSEKKTFRRVLEKNSKKFWWKTKIKIKYSFFNFSAKKQLKIENRSMRKGHFEMQIEYWLNLLHFWWGKENTNCERKWASAISAGNPVKEI